LITESDVIASRKDELAVLLNHLRDGDCCSVVGMSNVGKSELLRAACQFDVQPEHLQGSQANYLLVHIDLNLMLEMTDQGFYELIVRSLLAALESRSVDAHFRDDVSRRYDDIVGSKGEFLISHAFNEALTTFARQWSPGVVLLLDEFDHPFTGIDERLFLNLRALRDRYEDKIVYVTATNRSLPETRSGRDVGEFCELFTHQTLYLPPLARQHASKLIEAFAEEEQVTFAPHEVELILSQAGGHPGLLQAACYAVAAARSEEETLALNPRFRAERLQDALDGDPAIQSECMKLWLDILADERDALMACVTPGETPDPRSLDSLRQLHLIRDLDEGPWPFCSLLASFVNRRRFDTQPGSRGVRIDVEAGSVWVDGKLIPPLTNLEYRLLLLLYGHLDQICDKYSIVETVWGEEYIDEVDDARIEKLVSRLRQKIEPDPAEPTYLATVRGRGYRLVSP
jgi:hypothetical protein